jgi:TonB family protein
MRLKRIAPLLPLLALLLVPGAAPAQETPSQSKPPRFLLGGVEPLLNDQMKVVDLLLAKRWQEARRLAHQQFLALAGYTDDYPASVATGLVLEALADAGLGDESMALCRWNAAQNLDPNLVKADLSNFGDAGTLLTRHAKPASAADPELLNPPEPIRLDQAPSGKLPHDPEVTRPEILSKSSPEYPLAARKARLEGQVVVEAVIERDGHVLRTRLLQTQPKGLGLAAIDAICGWRFKPATLKGEPVPVYYVLTVNFNVQKGPPPAISNP